MTPAAELVPPLKWAGGKRWLWHKYNQIIPDDFNRYLEPFLGGGAIFFHLKPMEAILSDSNKDLIVTYIALRDTPEEVQTILKAHSERHSEKYYYEVRRSKPTTPAQLAAWLMYLNRSCYNGLYRVNKRGEFNVPKGTKTNILLPYDDFPGISKALSGVELNSRDFEITVDRATDGDFLFVDPPYTVRHNTNGFLKYNEEIFSWQDQERLARAVKRAANRGTKILVSNADHSSVRELYKDVGTTLTLERHSVIGGGSGYRSGTTEIAVRINY